MPIEMRFPHEHSPKGDVVEHLKIEIAFKTSEIRDPLEKPRTVIEMN